MADLVTKIVLQGDATGATASLGQVKTGLNDLGAAGQRAGAEAGAGLEKAFATVGVRSAQTINAEIEKVRAAMVRVGSSSTATGDEIQRAFVAGAQKIAALQAELAPIPAKTSALASGFGPIGAAIAAAFAVDKIVKTAVEMDTLGRSFQTVTGSSTAAAAEMAYVGQVAARLGLEVQSTGKAWQGFSLATQGTALAGQAARDIFEAVAGSMAHLGKSSGETESALGALTKMVSLGAVQMGDLTGVFGDKLPVALKLSAEGLGLTKEELVKMIGEGKVLANDLLPVLASSLQKTFAADQEVKGFAAEWGRLTTAVTLGIDAFAQTPVVVATVSGAMGALKMVIGVLALVVSTLAEGFSYLGATFGALLAVLNRKITASEALDDLALKSRESTAKLATLAEQMGLTQKSATGLAAGATAAAQAAAGATGAHLKLGLSLSEAGKAYAGYGQNLQAAHAADQIRQQTAVESIALLGKESATLAAKTVAVQAGLAALQQEIAAKQGEMVVARESLALAEKTAAQHQARLAQQGASLEVMEKQAAADAVAIKSADDLVQKRQQEIVALQAQAGAQSLATEKAQLAAQTYQDNSARVVELRAATVTATETLRLMQELQAKGIVSDTAVATAQRGLREATVMYQDALADLVEKLKDKEAAEQRHTALAAQAIGVDISAAKAAQDVAKAKGDETEAIQQAIKVKVLEAAQAHAVADGKQAEAKAAQDTATARIAEIQAVGELTEAKKAEIAALNDSVTSKKLDADAAEQSAKGADAAAEAAKKLAEAQQEAGAASNIVQRAVNSTALDMQALANDSGAASGSLTVFTQKFNELIGADQRSSLMVGAKIQDAGVAAAQYTQDVARAADLTEQLGRSAQGGAQGLSALIAEADQAASGMTNLGEQDLGRLRSAIAQAKAQMESLKDSADATLSSLNQELAQMNGNFAEAERLAQASRRAELESKIAIANAQGNNAAAATLTQALATLDQIAGQKIAEARQREADELARSSASSSQASAAAGNLNQAAGSANTAANSLRSLASSSVTMGGAATQLAATTGSVAGAAASFAGAIGATQAASAQMAKAAHDLGQSSAGYGGSAGVSDNSLASGERRTGEASSADARTSAGNAPSRTTNNFNIGGVLDINDRATLDTLSRRLAPMFKDLDRRSR